MGSTKKCDFLELLFLSLKEFLLINSVVFKPTYLSGLFIVVGNKLTRINLADPNWGVYLQLY